MSHERVNFYESRAKRSNTAIISVHWPFLNNFAPILEEIAASNPQIKIAKLNVDENPLQSAAARVTSIPTMNVYVNGELVKQIIGAKPKAALLADLAAYL